MSRRYCLCCLAFLSLTAVVTVTSPSQWTRAGGPYSNNPVSFLSVAAQGDTLFAGSYQWDALYRSTDNGSTWTVSLDQDHVQSMAFGENTLFACMPQHIFRSSDFGISWRASASTLPNPQAIEAHPAGLFAATDFGVYRSTDGGENWQAARDGLPVVLGSATVFDVKALSGALYAATRDGVYGSSDAGEHWFPLHNGFPQDSRGFRPRINHIMLSGSDLFAATHGYGVYRSTDGGNMWVAVNAGLPQSSQNPSYLESIYSVISSNGRLYLGLDGGSVYISSNGGTSWYRGTSRIAQQAYVFAFAQRNSELLAATLDGIFRSTDIESVWVPVFTHFPKIVSVLAIASQGANIIASGTSRSVNGSVSGTFTTSNLGTSWQTIDTTSPVTSFTCFLESNGTLLGGGWSGIFRSTNHGIRWSAPDSGEMPYYTRAIAQTSYGVLAATGIASDWFQRGGIFRTTNDGSSWFRFALRDSVVYSIAELHSLLFAGTQRLIYRSSNGGLSWEAASNGLPATAPVHSLCTIGGNIFAASRRGVYRSTDSGDHWTLMNNGLPSDSSGSAGLFHLVRLADRLVACSRYGIFFSSNLGASWINWSMGLPLEAVSVQSAAIHANRFLIGTSDGVWHRPLTDLTTVGSSYATPLRFFLGQNYPNPFNPSTNIVFTIHSSGWVTLKVFDMLGRKVKTLINEVKEAGEYSVTFDAAGLSSGAYFYTLEVGGRRLMRQMILVR